MKKIVQRGWSFIDDDGYVDADFFETVRPIPSWDFLKPIRVTRTVTYDVPKTPTTKQERFTR